MDLTPALLRGREVCAVLIVQNAISICSVGSITKKTELSVDTFERGFHDISQSERGGTSKFPPDTSDTGKQVRIKDGLSDTQGPDVTSSLRINSSIITCMTSA